MKRWFRPVAYSIILILGALAIFGGSPVDQSVAAQTVRPMRIATHADVPAAASAKPAASQVHVRSNAMFASALFAPIVRPAPAVASEVVSAPVPAPPAEMKILGWMQSGSMPYVFVELNGENYTLSPNQMADDLYRFDKLADGMADFTYLPTGQTRQHAVSDSADTE